MLTCVESRASGRWVRVDLSLQLAIEDSNLLDRSRRLGSVGPQLSECFQCMARIHDGGAGTHVDRHAERLDHFVPRSSLLQGRLGVKTNAIVAPDRDRYSERDQLFGFVVERLLCQRSLRYSGKMPSSSPAHRRAGHAAEQRVPSLAPANSASETLHSMRRYGRPISDSAPSWNRSKAPASYRPGRC